MNSLMDELNSRDMCNRGEYTYREGDYSSLINGSARKYTHHPVAALGEALKIKMFRHVSSKRILEIISEAVSTRNLNGWHSTMFCNNRTATDYVYAREVPIDETITAVAMFCGCKCYTCENMAWDGIGLAESRKSHWTLNEKREKSFKEAGKRGGAFYSSRVCSPSAYIPIVCEFCAVPLQKAQIAFTEKTGEYWGNEDVIFNAFLLSLIEKELGIEQAPKRKRRK
jgi:hypothetical protein